MDNVLRSLIYYVKWLRHMGVERDQLDGNIDDLCTYVSQSLDDNPIGKNWRVSNWDGAGTPLPIGQCNDRTYFAEAVDMAYANPSAQCDVPMPATNYFPQYIQQECNTEEERATLQMDVNSFWQRLNAYMTPQNQRAYGLAAGKVQSGKTRNYIGLMFKAIDEGYNTVIILTSKSSLLAVQTQDRVEKWFGNDGFRIPNYQMLTQVRPDGTGVDWRGGQFAHNRIQVGIVLKNERGHLERVRDWMHGIGTAVNDMKLLFIDDESDSATPNTRGVNEDIENEDDVELLVRTVDMSGLPGKADIIDWIRNICYGDIDEDDRQGMEGILRQATTDSALMDAVRQDAQFKRLARLDSDVEINRQIHPLWSLVYNAFNRRATRRQPLNTSKLRALLNYAFGIKQERSRINRSVCALVGRPGSEDPSQFAYKKMIYVGYTATPFANLLNEDPTSDPLCPDCIKPLTTNSRYFGLQRIFGGDGDECNMDIVRTIEPDEYEGWVCAMQDGDIRPDLVGVNVERMERRHNFAEEGQPEDCRAVEWKSLKRAVMWAFCTAAARRVNRLANIDTDITIPFAERKYRWTTMLFNLSHLSGQDEGVQPVQQELLRRYIESRAAPENVDEFVSDCLQLWNEETHRFTRQDFDAACPGYGTANPYPPADRIENEIRNWFLRYAGKWHVIQMNSFARNQPDYNDGGRWDGDVLWFVCGGNVLSRGLTLEGLTVSYFDRIRGSSAVDTITQMGRWFGYRPGYELLPRIWMTDATIKEMKQICRVEESLHGSLAELFGDDNTIPPSISAGADVAAVRFFGRRLSGRDANGVVFNEAASRGIFRDVNDGGDHAIGATRQFVSGLGDAFPVQADSTRPVNRRHRLFWKDVGYGTIANYINRLLDGYLAGASIYEAQGLLHEINNSRDNWNVVVGNPDTDRHFGEDGGIFAGLGIRNNPFRRGIGAAVQIGTGQLTSGAFLARMPDRLTGQARENLNNPNVVEGDMRHVEETFRLAFDLDRSLANPTLLIDFVHGDDDIPYVQVSFYWYGRSEEAYIKAVANPKPPSDMLQQAIEIVERQHYISFHALCRCLGTAENDQLLDDLESESQNCGSAIGEVSVEEAEQALIQPRVFYSKNWIKKIPWPPAIGIGRDLYQRILDRWYNPTTERVDFDAVEQNYLEYIIPYRGWGGFAYKYEKYRQNFMVMERCRELIQKWKDFLQENDVNGQNEVVDEFKKMANQGSPLAQYRLGTLLLNLNPDRAEDYFNTAAIHMEELIGYPGGDAELCLAEMCYYGGRGRDRNLDDARRWCQRAQELWNPAAAALLTDIEQYA